MTREESEALAEELARHHSSGIGEGNLATPIYWRGCIEAAVREALDSVRKPTRVEAAERAVIERAISWNQSPMTGNDDQGNEDAAHRAKMLDDAVNALRKVRERAQVMELVAAGRAEKVRKGAKR